MSLTRRDLAVLSAASALAAAAPARAQAAPDRLRIAFAARGNRTLDPANSIQGADDWSITSIHDRLVASPPGTFATSPEQFEPRLAERWSVSPDGKTWSFTLRQGVQFHKGYGECTAEDVAFSINRARDPAQGSGSRALFENVVDVRTDGTYGVLIGLKEPDPLFISGTVQAGACSIMCRKAVLEKGEAIGRDPIGTGPYQFTSLDPDPSQGVLMTANMDYFRGAPPTREVQVLYILDTTARTLALLSGNVHMIEGARAPGWTASIKQRNPKLHFDVAAPGSFFTMHFNLGRKPLDDVRVRRAFAYAIDRAAIARALAPVGARTYGVIPPGFPGGLSRDDVPAALRYDHDPAHAKALLADAGLAGGVVIDAYTSQREDYRAIMLIVQEQMRKVGVTINLQIIDHTTFHANNRKDMNSLPQYSSAYPPTPLLPLADVLSRRTEVKADGSGGTNYSHYGVLMPGIDDILEAAAAEPEFKARAALVRKAELRVLEDLPLLPICTNGYLVVRDPRVTLGYEVKSGFAYWPVNQAVIA